jgi:parvulin-like peptidyl-prolyl isomerase
VGRHFVAYKLYVHAAGDEQVKAFGEELIRRTKAGAKLEDALEAQLASLVPAAAKKPGNDKAPEVPALTALDRPRIEISAPFPSSGNPLPQVTPKEPLAARAFELKTPDEVWQTPIQTSEGAVVLQLKEKNAASRADFDKNKAELLGPMRAAKANEALVYYIADLRKKAGDKLKVDARFGEEAKASNRDEE